MLTKDELKQALGEETRIIRHIATKVDPAKVDWRPSENQRSIAELMRYLSYCGAAPAKAMLEGDWGLVKGYESRNATLDLAGFDGAMEAQEKEFGAMIDGLADSDLSDRHVKLPWGTERPLGSALFETSVRFLCAYRQVLFVYAKASGADGINTYNAWLGIDPPPAQA